MSSAYSRLLIFLALFLFMAVLEVFLEARAREQSRKVRWSHNLGLLMIGALVLRLVVPGGLVFIALWAQKQELGLLNSIKNFELMKILAGVLLLDLLIYFQHLLSHELSWFWRFHQVHHADIELDVSTGIRFHPLELLISFLFKSLVVVALGLPAQSVFIFELSLNSFALFTHANIRLPALAEKFLRFVFVTPKMHEVHHSHLVTYCNSNYSNTLSFWDRLFGTYRPDLPEDKKIGLDHSRQIQQHRLGYLLLLPFRKPK